MQRSVSTTPVDLGNFTTRGSRRKINVDSVALVLGGFAFVFFGSPITYAMNLDMPHNSFPAAYRYTVGPGMCLVGIVLFVICYSRYRSRRNTEAANKKQFPMKWMASYPWEPNGTAVDSSLGIRVAIAAFLTVWMLGFAIVMISLNVENGPGLLMKVVLCCIDVVLLLFVGKTAIEVVRRLKYGKSRLAFATCPFILGQTMNVTFVPGRPIRRCSYLQATLRCVQEMEVGSGDDSKTECTRLYEQTFGIAEPGEIGPLTPFPLSFELPQSPGFSTTIFETPVQYYWEILIHAEPPGLHYDALFLLPVYSAEAAGITRST